MQARDLGRTILLCVIGGSADAIAYLRYHTFVGAMTGNTVLSGIDLAEWRPESAIYHLVIIAVFLLAVIATQTALKIRVRANLPLFLTALMLGGSELIGSEWSIAICAAALGIQNAAVRTIGGVSVNTVFVTGNLLRLGSAVPHASQPKHQITLVLLETAWAAYAAGAAIGAVTLHFVTHAMIVPAVLALVAALAEFSTITEPIGEEA